MPRHITPKRYLLEYSDDRVTVPRFVEVRVVTADILKAEETGPTYAITNPQTQSIAMTTMWLWAAFCRTQNVKVPWPDFRKNLVDFEKIGDAEPVDPTQQAEHTTSLSPSEPQESGDSTSTPGNEHSGPTNA